MVTTLILLQDHTILLPLQASWKATDKEQSGARFERGSDERIETNKEKERERKSGGRRRKERTKDCRECLSKDSVAEMRIKKKQRQSQMHL